MDGEQSHFAPVFPTVATATVLKSEAKLCSFPTHFASTRSAAQTPSSIEIKPCSNVETALWKTTGTDYWVARMYADPGQSDADRN